MVPIQSFMDNWGIDEMRWLPVWVQWVKEAEDAIGSRYSYHRKITVLTVKDCKAVLPACTQSVRWVILGDHGCDCDAMFDRIENYGISGGCIIVDTDGTVLQSPLKYEIYDNTLVFSGELKDGFVTVRYYSYPEDENGLPMVNEHHSRAIAQYLTWMESRKRSRFEQGYTRGVIKDEEVEWHRLCADARVQPKTEQDRQVIADIVNNPLSGGHTTKILYDGTI